MALPSRLLVTLYQKCACLFIIPFKSRVIFLSGKRNLGEKYAILTSSLEIRGEQIFWLFALEEVQHDSIYELNELTLLILTEMHLLAFWLNWCTRTCPLTATAGCRACRLRDLSIMVSKNRLKLLDAASIRFKNLKTDGLCQWHWPR